MPPHRACSIYGKLLHMIFYFGWHVFIACYAMIQFFRCCGTITTRRMEAGRMRKATTMSEWCRYSSIVLIAGSVVQLNSALDWGGFCVGIISNAQGYSTSCVKTAKGPRGGYKCDSSQDSRELPEDPTSVELKNMTEGGGGFYSCYFKNEYGEAVSSGWVEVMETLPVHQKMHDKHHHGETEET